VVGALPNAPAVPAYGSVPLAVNNRHSRERRYGFDCSSSRPELELDLRYAQPGLSALRSKHDGVSMYRLLSQRLAAGVGAGNVR
jgi:hypothetical protein